MRLNWSHPSVATHDTIGVGKSMTGSGTITGLLGRGGWILFLVGGVIRSLLKSKRMIKV